MDSKRLRPAYDTFFEQSDAGTYFIDKLYDLIESQHELAEKNPENARDYVQKALGIREVLNHIKSTMTEVKTKSPTEKRER